MNAYRGVLRSSQTFSLVSTATGSEHKLVLHPSSAVRRSVAALSPKVGRESAV
jgi:hypothetical protein